MTNITKAIYNIGEKPLDKELSTNGQKNMIVYFK